MVSRRGAAEQRWNGADEGTPIDHVLFAYLTSATALIVSSAQRKKGSPKRRPPFLSGMSLTYFRSMQLA